MISDLPIRDAARNYWKNYATEQIDDATIAHELLTVLHDVYGYNGQPTLKVKTEEAN
jgi:hypothetical protein